jgi:hypothetical protein
VFSDGVPMRYDALLDFKVLETLLYDSNLPESCRNIALERISNIISKRHPEESMNLSKDIYVLNRSEFDELRARGPKPNFGKNYVRVATFMPITNLRDFHIRNGHDPQPFLNDLEFFERLPSDFLDNSLDLSFSPRSIRWITLAKDLDEYNYEDIINSLIHIYEPSMLAAVEYDIDTNLLHVPTIIDSGFYPGFISKPKGIGIESRAWNWRNNEWGPHEFVHNSCIKYNNLCIRLIEVDSSSVASYPRMLFRSYEFKDIGEIEKHLTRLFRAVSAYNHLEPFVMAKGTVLKLTSREFEQFVSLLFEAQGYETTITKPTHDAGVDVIAHWDKEKRDGVLIEAKHTKRTVGIRVIRELIGARTLLDDELSKYIMTVVTTSKFSHQAYKAQERLIHELKLIDYQKIAKELNQYSNIGVRKVFDDVIGNKY